MEQCMCLKPAVIRVRASKGGQLSRNRGCGKPGDQNLILPHLHPITMLGWSTKHSTYPTSDL